MGATMIDLPATWQSLSGPSSALATWHTPAVSALPRGNLRERSQSGQLPVAAWRLFARGRGHVAGREEPTSWPVLRAATEGAHVAEPERPAGLQPIRSEDELDTVLAQAEEKGHGVVIDWMAQWCRKCIYLQPKIEKLAEDYPDMQFCVVDVNSVPAALVKRGQVTKMPTIQLWKHGKWYAEVIGGHKAWMVIDEIRAMLSQSNH